MFDLRWRSDHARESGFVILVFTKQLEKWTSNITLDWAHGYDSKLIISILTWDIAAIIDEQKHDLHTKFLSHLPWLRPDNDVTIDFAMQYETHQFIHQYVRLLMLSNLLNSGFINAHIHDRSHDK